MFKVVKNNVIDFEKYKKMSSNCPNKGVDDKMNNYGKITHRLDGRYEKKLTVQGERISLYAKSEAELKRKIKEALENGIKRPHVEQSLTVGEWLEKYITLYRTKTAGDKTLIDYRHGIKNHFKEICSKKLNKVTSLELQTAISDIKANRTRKILYQLLSASFAKAYALRLIKFDPVLAVECPVVNGVTRNALTPQQFTIIYNNAPTKQYKVYLIFLLLTGARRSEALIAKWADIDFVKKTIKINGTKTKTATGYVFMPEILEKILRDWKNAQLVTNDKIFDITPNYATHVFSDLRQRLLPEVKNICLHSLRHTYATMLAQLGVAPKVAQKLMRHADITTTLNIYTHTSDSFFHAECKKIDGISQFFDDNFDDTF